ncbi:carbohydrate kinase family protein [Actinoalloteichus hymeniacidonis]|uniref:Sugar kinase, ribokinase n=1 Tax=Actinoalloteichus hymeniacidonis TaxID=340345 RepID=A0AAC9HP85_9PSEU|nr:sugar kinase [Actinoalloteichus hymeniacidonis]AOS62481.1 sugar kinase, ribokinase [Actinoalloteichus hymeniacidonis]MBB5909488.1 sugar/nucleoside kinase (ribokinase family) [Actinoalloteichus hymeniacidonis]
MTAPRPRVVVVGDTGLDVVASHRAPLAFGGDTRARVTMTAGGAGANTSVWLARCDVEPLLVARVGDDSAGRQAAAELTSAGVRCVFTVDPNAATCCVVVLVDANGQRTMLPDRGASGRVSPDDLDPGLLDGTAGQRPAHLHLSGYLLLDRTSRPAGVAALRAAKEAGLTTSVDPQAAALLRAQGNDDFLAAIEGVDLLLPNTDELTALTGSPEPRSAASLLGLVGAVVVTTGESGASWVDAEGVISVEAPAVECVDSTGAGDAFNAGFLGSWLRGGAPLDALRAGVSAGSSAVSHVGAQPPPLDARPA